MAHIIDLQSSWQNTAAQVLMLKAQSLKTTQRLFRVSVVFVARGNSEEILASLTALLEQNVVRELLIVNCSSSQTLKQSLCDIVKKHPRTFVASGHPSYSLSKAYSVGMRHVTSRYVLLVTAPYILPKNALITVMKQLSLPKSSPWILGIDSGNKTPFDPFLGLQKQNGFKEKNDDPESGLAHIFSVTPDCLLLSAQMMNILGGFDAQCHDNNFLLDLCVRVHSVNGSVYTHPSFPRLKEKEAICVPQTMKATWQCWDYYYQKHFGVAYKKWHRAKLFVKLFLNRLLRRSL